MHRTGTQSRVKRELAHIRRPPVIIWIWLPTFQSSDEQDQETEKWMQRYRSRVVSKWLSPPIILARVSLKVSRSRTLTGLLYRHSMCTVLGGKQERLTIQRHIIRIRRRDKWRWTRNHPQGSPQPLLTSYTWRLSEWMNAKWELLLSLLHAERRKIS